MAAQDDSEGEGLSWAESLAAIVNCGMGVAFSGSDATESGGRIPPGPPPAEEDDTSSMVDNLLRCGGSEGGQTYDEGALYGRPSYVARGALFFGPPET